MRVKHISLLFPAMVFLSTFSAAQEVSHKKDSSVFYKNIESYSRRNDFTKFIYRLIFKPVEVIAPIKKNTSKTYKKLIRKPYSDFEGKIIRHINIETLDPFGTKIDDTTKSAQDIFSKMGNKLHVRSQHITIRNLLLIHKNQPFDSLLVKESERLVRSRNYVSEVSFRVVATSKNSDSVDIFIRELDNWSIIPSVAASTSRFTINLTDKNFLGLGHESQNGFSWYHTTGNSAVKVNYLAPNIRNTFVSTSLHYENDQYGNFNKAFSIDRPFFSSFTKWAAGVSFSQQFTMDSIYGIDSTYITRRFKSNVQDFWLGNAMQIFKGNSEDNRTTNFITTARYFRLHYIEKPLEINDPFQIYFNRDFYLIGIGISTRKYVQDKYIYKFGVIEDVPVGKVYGLTGGYEQRNSTGRLYLGARISLGNYFSWGYLSTNFEYGTFYKASQPQQGVLSAGATYFTGLIEIGEWKFRQFIKPQATVGIHRFSYENLNINDEYGINGFNSTSLTGTDRLLLKLQTQSYAPWNWIGFHFGPYFNYSIGMLGDAVSNFNNSKMYSQIGLGVLIKNENLIFGTFQFSISFYPSIPGIGQDLFKVNSFQTSDFGFRDFEIGKPTIPTFQ